MCVRVRVVLCVCVCVCVCVSEGGTRMRNNTSRVLCYASVQRRPGCVCVNTAVEAARGPDAPKPQAPSPRFEHPRAPTFFTSVFDAKLEQVVLAKGVQASCACFT